VTVMQDWAALPINLERSAAGREIKDKVITSYEPRRHPERTTLSYHKEVPRVTRKAAVCSKGFL
jgi:hypothetical protein